MDDFGKQVRSSAAHTIEKFGTPPKADLRAVRQRSQTLRRRRNLMTSVSVVASVALILFASNMLIRSSGAPKNDERQGNSVASNEVDATPGEKSGAISCADEGLRRDPPRASGDTSQVAVYFSCKATIGSKNQPVYGLEREVSGDSKSLERRLSVAMQEYLEGPTRDERAQGYVNAIGGTVSGGLDEVAVLNGEATVGFTPEIEEMGSLTTTASLVLQLELKAIAFQFPQIERLDLQVEGSCDRFWRMLESDCQELRRHR